MPSDTLKSRLRKGTPGALEEVIQAHGSKLLNYIHRMVGDRWAAEDLLQEVFVKLLKQAPYVKETDNLPAWLFTVARNLSLNHMRGRRTAAQHAPPAPEVEAPDRHAEDAEMSRAIQSAINQLEEPLRSTFLLCAVGGNDYATVAEILGCPRKTVNTRMFRAWEKIRKIMKPHISGAR